MAAVIKELSSHLGDGIGAIVTAWSLYLLLAAGATIRRGALGRIPGAARKAWHRREPVRYWVMNLTVAWNIAEVELTVNYRKPDSML